MEPRIYVACLASYNSGRLYGRWIDATQDADVIMEEVSAMLKDSPTPGAEEWAIYDHEGFGSWRLGEWDSFEEVSVVAQMVAHHPVAFPAWLENGSGDGLEPDEWADAFAESYLGNYGSVEEYAQEAFGDVADHLERAEDEYYGRHRPDILLTNRIDWEGVARDLTLSGSIWVHEDGYHDVHIFGA